MSNLYDETIKRLKHYQLRCIMNTKRTDFSLEERMKNAWDYYQLTDVLCLLGVEHRETEIKAWKIKCGLTEQFVETLKELKDEQ